MALEFLTGFDYYDDAAAGSQEWDLFVNTLWAYPGRFGGYAVQPGTLSKYLPAGALPTRTVGFAFIRIAADLEYAVIVPLVSFFDNSTATSQVELNYNYNTHQLTVTRNGTVIGTCGGTYLPGVWYYVEMQVTISATMGSVTVNAYPGGTVFSGVNLNTQASANATFDTLAMSTAQVAIDDLYVTNPSGGVNTGFLGECRISTVLPTGDSAVNHAFTASSGGAHFGCVSVQLDPTTDVPSVSADAVGAIDTYTFPAVALNGAVAGVKVSLCARKDDTGARTIASEFRDNAGNEHTGNVETLFSGYKYLGTAWDLNPATDAPWTAADFAGAQFGVKVTG